MFKDAWAQYLGPTQNAIKVMKQDLARIETQMNQLLQRVVEAGNPRLVAAYEFKIPELGVRSF
jgi:hypothetical protein